MPSARRSRTLAASPAELWELIGDPHHLPRWWPRVDRVEDVEGGAFTEVMRTAKGKLVRADFRVLDSDEQARSLTWEQQLEGTPFARLLSEARTHVALEPAGQGTLVTIELHQRLTGFFPRFGGFMVSRAAAKTVDEALDGLERIGG
ncbi:MAG TPA: SRPBCC family protein [Solirubrobacteraceae bacterium]|nr:SRPBCC family protein [Solirubrobacteraceae bacterium]